MKRAVVAHERALGQGCQPLLRIGPGQLVEVAWHIDVGGRGGPDRRQVDADMAQARRPRRQGGREGDPIVSNRAEPAQAPRHVDIRRREHTGTVEDLQQARRTQGQRGVEGVGPLDDGHGSPRSKRSLNEVTKLAGGRHDHTPQG